MIREQSLERARDALRLAILHCNLRDVSAEVAIVRESLASAGAEPTVIGTTEAELTERIRSGLLAEARIVFELAADHKASPAERDFLFEELVALVTKAVKTEASAEQTLDDAKAAEIIAAHDPSNGLVPWERARESGELAGVDMAEIDALNFDAFGETLPVARAEILPDDDPGPFIELDAEAAKDDEDPVITIGTVSIAPESLMPDGPPASFTERPAEPLLGPEAVNMAIRFFGEKDAAELGCIPTSTTEPVLLTEIIRHGTVPPPLPAHEGKAANDTDT